MKRLTRKEAQKQLAFLMALEKLDRLLNGQRKAKKPAKALKAQRAAAA